MLVQRIPSKIISSSKTTSALSIPRFWSNQFGKWMTTEIGREFAVLVPVNSPWEITLGKNPKIPMGNHLSKKTKNPHGKSP
jgi:hypothetical protein